MLLSEGSCDSYQSSFDGTADIDSALGGFSPRLAALLRAQVFGDDNATRYFLTIVRRGGFTMAARSLGLTHNALRNEITRLEERLGMRLFHAPGGRAKLTADGEQLFRLSEKLLDETSSTALYGVQKDLVLSIPTLVLESFLYRELISLLRENSGMKVSVVDDAREMQQTADLVVWLQEPQETNVLQKVLARSVHLSTLSFSLYATERLMRGRTLPVSLDDMEHSLTVQYDGYERFASFGDWNDRIAQRRHSTIHVESPQTQWQMVRWANCIGLLPNKSTYLDSGVKRLPALLETELGLDVWLGLNTQSADLPDVRMIAKRITRAFRGR